MTHTQDINTPLESADSLLTATGIPVETLVEEVFQSAPPTVQDRMVSQLVGKVFEIAPPQDKGNLIATLIRPLGILSLAAVAGGVFAKIRFRGGWPDVQVRTDDIQNVRPHDIVALASYTQQVSVHVLDSLAHVLTASPVLASTATAALLIKLLQHKRYSDFADRRLVSR
jgi:hypothetical protein